MARKAGQKSALSIMWFQAIFNSWISSRCRSLGGEGQDWFSLGEEMLPIVVAFLSITDWGWDLSLRDHC